MVIILFVLGVALLLISILFGRLYFRLTNGVCRDTTELSGKVILITGGNGGIGKEYVRDMARRKAKVIMACRNFVKGEECAKEIIAETNNPNIFVEKCDLNSLENVKSFCELIRKRESKIDVLVCFAAAVGNACEIASHTPDGFETNFQCNYLSHFLMIHMLIDLLKRSDQGRIVLTSSSAHLIGKIELDNISRFELYQRSSFMAYCDTKLALVLLAKELARRLSSKTAITANSFHPGTVYTDAIKGIHHWHIKYFLTLLAFIYGKSQTDGAQTLIYLTVAPEEAGTSGYYFSDCARAKHNKLADDRQLCLGLWNLSLDLIKPYINKIDPALMDN